MPTGQDEYTVFKTVLQKQNTSFKISAGAQGSLPQDMPQCHNDYFKLKLLKKQPVQDNSDSLSLVSRMQGMHFPRERYFLCTRK